MSLFDVSSISGVYARMNDIYSKLGEVHNVMRTLKNLLGLSKSHLFKWKLVILKEKNRRRHTDRPYQSIFFLLEESYLAV